MLREGMLTVHTSPPPHIPVLHPDTQKIIEFANEEEFSANYPPLSMYLFYVEAIILEQFDPRMVSNTIAARLSFSTLSVIANFIVAAGCFSIVRRLATPLAGAIAFVAVALGPPFILDSAHWGQTDTWVLAPLIWMVWAMLRQRWLTAGVLWGIALSIKPQGALLTPLWCAVFLLRPSWRVVVGIIIAPFILFLTGLPFTLGEGWAWLQRSYIDNLVHSYADTTLSAFNIWYVDLLICENDDAAGILLGLSKDLWGKLLFGTSILTLIALLLWRRERFPRSILAFTACLLLFSVILPTRVHERYIIMPLPFLIAATGFDRRLWWALAPLILAATFQISVLDWLGNSAAQWGYVEQKIHNQYEQYRRELPLEQFATLKPPPEMLAEIRPDYLKKRMESGDPIREWALTLLELLSAAGCAFVLGSWLLRKENRDMALVEENHQPSSPRE